MIEVIVEGREYTVEIAGETKTAEILHPASVVFDVVGGPGKKGDAGAGLPTGGTTGMVLSKKTDGDYDTEWKTPEAGGGGGISFAEDPGPVVAPGDSVLWVRPSAGSFSLIVRQG